MEGLENTETCAVECERRAKEGSRRLARRGRSWEGALGKGRRAQALLLGEAREKQAPCWLGRGLRSQRVEMGIMAKQPETSYCWGPISQWGMGRGTP